MEPLSGKQEQMASSQPPPLPGPVGHPGNYLSTRALGAATDRHTGQTTLQRRNDFSKIEVHVLIPGSGG